jgi:hypothetical protein
MDGIREVDASGDVGGAVDESPNRRWRLWYFSNDGRWLLVSQAKQEGHTRW